MVQTYEAVIDETGTVRLLEAVSLPGLRRALVTVLDEEVEAAVSETALLSGPALAGEPLCKPIVLKQRSNRMGH